jgi:hypothetical protein
MRRYIRVETDVLVNLYRKTIEKRYKDCTSKLEWIAVGVSSSPAKSLFRKCLRYSLWLSKINEYHR